MPVHSHGDVSHDHPDADPGHTHDTAAPAPTEPVATEPVATEPVATTSQPVGPTATPGMGTAAFAGSQAVRAILTVLGAAAMILGAYLDWVTEEGQTGGQGIKFPVKVFWSVSDIQEAGLFESAGLVIIVLGVLALIGLALPRGWLTRLAGALGIIAFVLFLITLYRVQEVTLGIGNIGIGMWLVLVGSVLAVIGGFYGPRVRTPVATAPV